MLANVISLDSMRRIPRVKSGYEVALETDGHAYADELRSRYGDDIPVCNGKIDHLELSRRALDELRELAQSPAPKSAPPAPQPTPVQHYPRSAKAQHRLMVDQLRKAAKKARAVADRADALATEAEAVIGSPKGWASKRGEKLAFDVLSLRRRVRDVAHRAGVASANAKVLHPCRWMDE